jgi:hypothetical protein
MKTEAAILQLKPLQDKLVMIMNIVMAIYGTKGASRILTWRISKFHLI